MADLIESPTDRNGIVSALQFYPNYRFLWISALGSHIGRWIEIVVGSWIVLQLTDSPFLVGLLNACRFAAMMTGPFSGAISDRYDRRRILLTGQAVYALSSILIMVLFMTSFLETWHLFVYTLIGGICYSFDFSSRYAITADMVDSSHLISAVSLLQVVPRVGIWRRRSLRSAASRVTKRG